MQRAGLLNIEDAVVKYLPELKDQRSKKDQPITIKDLLLAKFSFLFLFVLFLLYNERELILLIPSQLVSKKDVTGVLLLLLSMFIFFWNEISHGGNTGGGGVNKDGAQLERKGKIG